MSRHESKVPITTAGLLACKKSSKKISMITCYDAAFGKIIADSAIDMVLVGDSLGNVILGFDSTIPVTMAHMIHHTASVTRVVKRPLVAADLPFMSYSTVHDALKHAAQLIQQGGASAVKLEGGRSVCPQIKAIVDAGIPVIGHLGLTPQSVHALGGYKVQGKTAAARKRMMTDALAIQEAGAFCLVLELIPEDLAKEISETLVIPTIGIGAGPHCDGQVLVLHDLLGFDKKFTPKFLKRYMNLGEDVLAALNEYDRDVKEKSFPSAEHSFRT